MELEGFWCIRGVLAADLVRKPAQVYDLVADRLLGYTGEGEQVVDDLPHPLRAAPDAVEVIHADFVQLTCVIFLQELTEAGNAPQRRTKIVCHGVTERLQAAVGVGEIGCPLLHPLFQLFVQAAAFGIQTGVLLRDPGLRDEGVTQSYAEPVEEQRQENEAQAHEEDRTLRSD